MAQRIHGSTRITKMIHGYYFLATMTGLMIVLAGLSSLLVYEPAAIASVSCWTGCVIGIVCSMIRFSDIKKAIREAFPDDAGAAPVSTADTKAKAFGAFRVTAILVLLLLGCYPLFPFWLRSMFLATAVSLLICGKLWKYKPYRKLIQYTKTKEDEGK